MMVYSVETPAARKIAEFIRKRAKEGVTIEDEQKAIREALA